MNHNSLQARITEGIDHSVMSLDGVTYGVFSDNICFSVGKAVRVR